MQAIETLTPFSLPTSPSPPSPLRKLASFAGPGLLVAVGYMDPGNWATDLAGGSQYGYALLWVVAISSLMAMVLQHLAMKLGIATGRDLAEACRDRCSPRVNVSLWLFAELQIAACDLAEVLGAAMALQILFGMPLLVGVLVTVLDVMLLLFFEGRGVRKLEALVAALVAAVALAFVYEWLVAAPSTREVLHGFVPRGAIFRDPNMLWVAIGILGATVMPHNLYLHSSVVKSRITDRSERGRADAIRLASWDSTLSLGIAFFVNVSILVLSAAAFHGGPHQGVSDLREAHRLIAPALGAPLAGLAFAVALLAAGQSATITGTLAGQVIMEGFVDVKMRPWKRRLLTRALAIAPAVIVMAVCGEGAVGKLLIETQVVLSLQLPFAVIPLVRFTSDRKVMGRFVNGRWLRRTSWGITGAIVAMNAYLLIAML